MSLTFQNLTNPLQNQLMDNKNSTFMVGKIGSGLPSAFFGGSSSSNIPTFRAPGTTLARSAIKGGSALSSNKSVFFQHANYNQPPVGYLKGPRAVYSVSFAPQGSKPFIPDLGIAFQPPRQDFAYI